jgi:hypothetical protein
VFGFELNTAVGRPTPKEVVAMATDAAIAASNQKNDPAANGAGATTPIGPLTKMTLSQYVATVMESDKALGADARLHSGAGRGSGGDSVETRYIFNTMERSPLEADFEVPPVLAACSAGTAVGTAPASTSPADTSTSETASADTDADTSIDTAGTAGASGAGGAGGAGPAARPFSDCIHPEGKFEFFFGYVCCIAVISTIAPHRL